MSVTWDSPETCVRQKSTSVTQILVSMVTVLIWLPTLHVPVGMVLRDYCVQVTHYIYLILSAWYLLFWICTDVSTYRSQNGQQYWHRYTCHMFLEINL